MQICLEITASLLEKDPGSKLKEDLFIQLGATAMNLVFGKELALNISKMRGIIQKQNPSQSTLPPMSASTSSIGFKLSNCLIA